MIAAARHFLGGLVDAHDVLGDLARYLRGFRHACVRIVYARRRLGDVPGDILGRGRLLFDGGRNRSDNGAHSWMICETFPISVIPPAVAD